MKIFVDITEAFNIGMFVTPYLLGVSCVMPITHQTFE